MRQKEKEDKLEMKQKDSSDEREKKEDAAQQKLAPWREMFLFAKPFDWLLMVVGGVFAFGKGCLYPLLLMAFAGMLNSFVGNYRQVLVANSTADGNGTSSLTVNTSPFDDKGGLTQTLFGPVPTRTCFNLSDSNEIRQLNTFQHASSATPPTTLWKTLPMHCRTLALNNSGSDIMYYIYWFLYIGAAAFVLAYVHSLCWILTAARQAALMRRENFRAIMRQDIAWFDAQNTRKLPTQLVESVAKVQEGLETINMVIENVTAFVASFVVALVYGWELGLIILGTCPLIALGGFLMMRVSARAASHELAAYTRAGAIAEETFTNIRTVSALGCEQKQTDKYASKLSSATMAGVRKGVAVGVGQGFMWGVIFCSYALAFGVGAWLVRRSTANHDERYNIGTILLVFFCVLVGGMQIGLVAPSLQIIASARAAVYVIRSVVRRKPPIDSSSDGGQHPQPIKGKISFQNVSFRYATRPEVPILQNLNLEIEPGTTVALVGASGCGKSTAMQLVQRFYDPDAGTVLLDNVDLRTWNVSHLRNVVGIVAQEPVLFETTIGENIRYGRTGVTQPEIEDACKMANIYDFIMSLPNKFETQVGQKGSQLSGGEKQRIAIARALVKAPAVLLLDEATSALDSVSERLVQQAIDKVTNAASTRRTVLVIAHRLSTIRSATRIIALKDGCVEESGTHSELMAKKGLYYALVQAQTSKTKEEQAAAAAATGGSSTSSSGSSTEQDDYNSDIVTRKKEKASDLSDEGTNSTVEVHDETESDKVDTKHVAVATVGDNKRASACEQNVDNNTASSRRKSNGTAEMGKSAASENDEEVEDKPGNPEIWRLIKLNASEWWLIIIGVFFAMCAGAVMPIYAVLMSEMLKVFAETDPGKQSSQALFWCMMFLVLGAGTFLSNVIQYTTLGVAGERLTSRLRRKMFAAIVKQDIEFFDWPKNTVGSLTTKLASDTATVQAATGSAFALILQCIFTLVVAFGIGFYFAWKVVLVLLGCVPFIIVGSFAHQKIVTGQAKGSQAALERASAVVTEAIEQIRTVAMLNLEPHFVAEYNSRLQKANRQGIIRAFFGSIAFGYSQGIQFFAFALAFWSGWQFIKQSWLDDSTDVKFDFSDMMKALMGIMMGAVNIGQVSSFGASFGKAKLASARIFAVLDRRPRIDVSSTSGYIPLDQVRGDIEFKSVYFRYPTRRAMPILRGLTFGLEHGKSLGLVGHSGCGKSTVIQLLERFYDPEDGGEVVLDGKPLKSYNLKWLRRQFGLVGQEPVLFGGTVRENIGYGCETTPTYEQVVDAARAANIHDFIMLLPQQYDTFLGDKGTQLSGGQKQRLAIARALIRKPRILLLDEATSALDTESEHVVQDALERAMQGCTSITIAHRLNTIQNSDAIAVIDKGRLAEFGSHRQLMELGSDGLYHKAQTTLKGHTPS